MNSDQLLVSADIVADWLGIDASRVHQLSRSGVFPRPTQKGLGYNLKGCIRAYLEYKIKTQEESKEKEQNGYWNEKTRLTKAQADKEELAVAEKKGQLVDAVEIIQEYSNYVLACRAKLLSMPTKLAYELIEIDNPNIIQNKLEQAIDEALLELGSEEFINSSIRETNPEDSQ